MKIIKNHISELEQIIFSYNTPAVILKNNTKEYSGKNYFKKFYKFLKQKFYYKKIF